jgi:hypothetical protein
MDVAQDPEFAGVIDFAAVVDEATGASALDAAHAALHALDHLGGELACRGAAPEDFGPLLVDDVRRLVAMTAGARAREAGRPEARVEALVDACARSDRFAYLTGIAMPGARVDQRVLVI